MNVITGRGAVVAWALVLLGSGCQGPERTGAASDAGSAPSLAALSPSSLQVAPDRLTRLELSKKEPNGETRRIALAREGGQWWVVSPVRHEANRPVVDSIVAVLAEIEILRTVSRAPAAAKGHRVDEQHGLEVRAWTGAQLARHFFVGRASREETHVRVHDDPRVLVVRGRCLPRFDRNLDELRHPTVTDIDVTRIEQVRYRNPHGQIDLVADNGGPGDFTARGRPIRNFDKARARKNVAVLAHLRARRFVDDPPNREATGLFGDDTPRARLVVRQPEGPPRSVDVWIGTRTADRLVHVRTSEGKQIYLVPAYLRTSLVPRRRDFERSAEVMAELRAKENQAKSGAVHPAHRHPSSKAPMSQVPPELLTELRALARQQQRHP